MPLTFTPGSWDSAQTITVQGVEDAVETAESYASSLIHSVSSSDAEFDGSAPLWFPLSEVRPRQIARK